MEFNFSPQEIRVLGVLVEKETTTPEYYPLSLNATKNACNQKSSREPVMELSEAEVESAFKRLLGRGLTLYRGEKGSRVSKFEHLFTSTFRLDDKQKTVMCLLMLRGPQTAGEIKSRSGRLYEFTSVPEVEQVLEGLIQREPQALVAKLPKQPGRKENRYGHLLSGPSEEAEPVPAPAARSLDPETAVLETPPPHKPQAWEVALGELRDQVAQLRQDFEEFKKQFEG